MSAADWQVTVLCVLATIGLAISFVPTCAYLVREDKHNAPIALKVYAIIQLILVIAIVLYIASITPEKHVPEIYII